MLSFSKYQALGNDFVVIDARSRPELVDDTALAVQLLDRHRGIGGDDVVFLTTSLAADFGMRIRTPSGGWLSMCGNGIRCLGRYARDHGLWSSERLTAESAVGVRELRWLGDPRERITVDLLEPDLRAAAIPTTLAAPGEQVVDRPLDIQQRPMSLATSSGAGEPLRPMPYVLSPAVTCVSVGNPHAVFFVDDLASVAMERLGPLIEQHPAFPEGVNVHAAQVLAPDRARILTWERGAGLTLA